MGIVIIIQSLCRVWLCNPMDCSMPAFLALHYLPELAQNHVYWVSDAIQPSRPLSPPSPPALNLSQHQGLFQWVGFFHQMATVLELPQQSFQWIFRLISFRIDWFDLLAVQGTLRSLLQLHNLKASILQQSAFFMVPTFTSVHEYWKKHIFDHTHLCWQSDVCDF